MSGESSVRELRATGLQGVSLGETEIALVDGENGRLIYRGHDAEQLAHESTFEATAFLLWNGRLPDDAELSDLRHRAVGGMVVPSEVHDAIRALGASALPMDVLRTGLSIWGAMRARAEGGDSEDALWALAATPAIVADYARLRAGEEILAPDPELGIVENYLLKLSGQRPEAAQARALDAYFILGAEHGMNASTFTARVIVSTLSDLASGLVGAVGALKGPLHGGAPSHVSHMIDEIGTAENAEPWLRRKLEAGEVLMGFGHRVYRTYDPRARALGEVAESLAGENERLALARHVEEIALRLLDEYKPGRKLYTNVEYYAAVVLGGIALPPDLYPATFAAARTAGWTAHILEQLQHNRLIRPTVDYVGPMPES
jgi:citrate synthase